MSLILPLMIVLFSQFSDAGPPEKQLRNCDKDSDCVVVDGSLCGCAWLKGQDQFAVNKKHKANVEKQFEAERKSRQFRCGGVSDEAIINPAESIWTSC